MLKDGAGALMLKRMLYWMRKAVTRLFYGSREIPHMPLCRFVALRCV